MDQECVDQLLQEAGDGNIIKATTGIDGAGEVDEIVVVAKGVAAACVHRAVKRMQAEINKDNGIPAGYHLLADGFTLERDGAV